MQPGSDRPAVPPSQETGRAFCARETLCRKQRLQRTAQFKETYDQNRRWHGRHMVLFLRAAPDASLRLGVVASKKVGNAPERARAKRRLRDAFRRGSLVALETPDLDLRRQFYFIWHRQKYQTAAMQEFLAQCRELTAGVERSDQVQLLPIA